MSNKTNKSVETISRIKESLLEKKEKNSKNLFLGKYDLSVLTQREEEYFRQMIPKSGVIYIKGEPGKAKTAILESIARKLNLYYIDLRLSQIDETDVGLYPDKVEGEIDVIGLDGVITKR
jgi:Cdc6-like AAA superfamily ATPase